MRPGTAKHRLRLFAATIASITFVSGVSACGAIAADSGTNANEQVTFVFQWTPSYADTYYFVARDKGFYRDLGIDVEFVVPDSTSTATKLVASGRADFGYTWGPDLLTAYNAGLKIKSIGNTATLELGLITLPDGPQRISDLAENDVAIFTSMVYASMCRPRLLAANGLSVDDIGTIDAGFDSMTPLLADKVDASEGALSAEAVLLNEEIAPEKTTFFSYSDVCPPLQGSWITADRTIDESPETVRKFLEASLRGVKYMLDHPEQALALFQQHYPKDPSVKYPSLWPAWLKSLCPPSYDDNRGLGWMDERDWQNAIRIAHAEGIVEQAPKAEDVMTNEFLPTDPPVRAKACD